MDAIEPLGRHVLLTAWEDLPEPVQRATKVFLLDSLGVGVAGSRGPLAEALIAAHAGPGEARVLGRTVRLPAPAAALVNAYQVHCIEFDCIHDQAVVHPVTVLLGAALATIDSLPRAVPGRELLAAVALGVDVACRLGVASRAQMRFFRPGTAGAFAATAAAGRLAGLDQERLHDAMGITLAQLCGTMQAHTEGSALLPVQAGFTARNAVVACTLAAHGVPGPRQVLDGPYGYFALFEGEHDAAEVVRDLGRRFAIAEVSHKPFPSGRATHGIVDATLELVREHGFAASEVRAVHARVPPLTHQLVGRAPRAGMQANYARLCGAYALACALRNAGTGTGVGLDDFTDAALADPDTLALARRVRVERDASADANALAPVSVRIALAGGRCLERTQAAVYGSPARPMRRDAHLAKFRANCAAGAEPLAASAVQAAIEMVDRLESLADARELLALLQPAG